MPYAVTTLPAATTTRVSEEATISNGAPGASAV